jgi:hypothetical protein
LNGEMPVIQLYVMENINTIINLTLVMTNIYDSAFKRGTIFVSAITFIYALNFLKICLFVLFIGKSLREVGSPFYLVHSFFDFSVFFGYLIVILIYGSEANDIDFEIKDLLIKIQIDCNEAVILAH